MYRVIVYYQQHSDNHESHRAARVKAQVPRLIFLFKVRSEKVKVLQVGLEGRSYCNELAIIGLTRAPAAAYNALKHWLLHLMALRISKQLPSGSPLLPLAAIWLF